MPALQTRATLDACLRQMCPTPDCLHADHHLALVPACHPEALLRATYHGDGTLRLACGTCTALVARVAVYMLTCTLVPSACGHEEG